MIRVSEPKTEMPIGVLNSSSTKTNRKRRIKVSNLEASGHAASVPKNKFSRFRHFLFSFFTYWFIYENFIMMTKTPKPPVAYLLRHCFLHNYWTFVHLIWKTAASRSNLHLARSAFLLRAFESIKPAACSWAADWKRIILLSVRTEFIFTTIC